MEWRAGRAWDAACPALWLLLEHEAMGLAGRPRKRGPIMAGPRASWTGGIDFGGFALQIQVYNLAPAGTPSFTSVCPCHKEPIEQVKRCRTTEVVIAHEELLKSVPVGGALVVLDDDDVDAIKELTEQRTVMADILGFPPADTIPWHLAIGLYRVVPNAKIPGQERSLDVLWNGLWGNDCALIVQWIKRKGSKPTLAALRAQPDGTVEAAELPYVTQLRHDGVPSHVCNESAEAAQMFSLFVGGLGIDTGPFLHEAFTDTVAERREQIVAAKLDGVEIPEAAPAATPIAAVPDLMEAMRLALAGANAAKPAPVEAAADDDVSVGELRAREKLLLDKVPVRAPKTPAKPKPTGDAFAPKKKAKVTAW